MFRVTKTTISKWIKMTEVVDCSKNVCPCADKLRRLLVTRPKTNYDKINLNNLINIQKNKYEKCIKNI